MTTREEIVVRSGFDNTAIGHGLRTTQGMVKDFAGRVAGYLGGMFAGYQVIQFARSLVDFSKNIQLTADRLNVSTKSAQQFSYAAAMTGVELDQVSMAMERLAKAKEIVMGGGAGAIPLEGAFKQFRISLQDIQTLSPEQIFDRISESVGKTGDNAQVTTAAMELFGRAGGKLIPLLEQFTKLSDHAPIVNEEDIKNAAAFDDKIKGATISFKAMMLTGASAMTRWSSWRMVFYRTLHPHASDLELMKFGGILPSISKSSAPAVAQIDPTGQISEAMRRQAFAALHGTTEGLAGQDRINALLRERGKLYAAADYDANDALHLAEDQLLLQTNLNNLKQAQHQLDLQTIEDNKQLTDLQRQKAKLAAEEKYARIHSLTPYIPSLEDMANATPYGRNLTNQYFQGGQFDMMRGSPFLRSATDLKRMQLQYAWNVLHPGVNSEDFVNQQAKQIDTLKQVFVKAGIISPEDAYRTLMENTAKTNDGIQALVSRMQADGIPVTVASN